MANLPSTIKIAYQKQSKRSIANRTKDETSSFQPFRRISEKNVIDFTRSLSVMLKARLTILDAMDIIIKQEKKEIWKSVIKGIRSDIAKGKSLHESLKKESNTFSVQFIQLVQVGEASGTLDQVLERLASYLEKSYQLKQKVKSALVYPFIVICVAMLAVIFLLVFVVPTFVDMYQDFGAELPGPTQLILSISNFLVSFGFYILIGLSLILYFSRSSLKSERIKRGFEKAYLKIPLIGTLYQKTQIASFTKTLGTLTESGVTLTEALNLLSHSNSSILLNEEVQSLQKSVSRGKSLQSTLSGSTLFPEMVHQMIGVGEETAQLDEMLNQVSNYYQTEIDILVEGLTSVLEPILIIIVGLIVGIIIVSLYLPIFELTNVIG